MNPTYFLNTFTDFNYIAPMMVHSRDALDLVFHLPDLKRKTKVFFKERSSEILNFKFVKRHNVRALESEQDLKRFFAEFDGELVSTTPTLFHLIKRKKLLRKRWFGRNSRLIGIDYLGEDTGEMIGLLDLVFLSSPVWNHSYPEEKIVYGLPYWDVFTWDVVLELEKNLSFESDKTNIVVPEITQDGDLWFDDCFAYINQHNNENTHFYLKYRLKTKEELRRNEGLEKRLQEHGHTNFTAVYSPHFFTTARLLHECDQVVFTTNATLFIMDCMAAGASIERAYGTPRLDVWKEPAANTACDDYARDPEETRGALIWNQGKSTQQFFDVVA